jgi:hypothetical protein
MLNAAGGVRRRRSAGDNRTDKVMFVFVLATARQKSQWVSVTVVLYQRFKTLDTGAASLMRG